MLNAAYNGPEEGTDGQADWKRLTWGGKTILRLAHANDTPIVVSLIKWQPGA